MSTNFNPYGGLISSSGPLAGANTMRFSSKPAILSATGAWGFYYYGYRFYDPGMQRWLNRDPIEEAGSINIYAAFLNGPTCMYDAFGNRPEAKPRKPNPLNPLDLASAIEEYLRNSPIPCSKVKPGKNVGDYSHCMFGCLLTRLSPNGVYGWLSGLSELTDFQWNDLISDYVGTGLGFLRPFDWRNRKMNDIHWCETKCKSYTCCD